MKHNSISNFRHSMPVAIAALSLHLILAPAAKADVTISTLGSISSVIQPWGTPSSGSTPTYGQVVVVPAGNPVLKDLTFKISNGNAVAIPYTAYVYAWTGSAIIGPALYTSAPLSVPPTGSIATFNPITISGINTALIPGNTYAVFFTTIGQAANVGSSRWQTSTAASYTSGKFIYNNALTFTGLFAPPNPVWNNNGDFNNSAFSMTFGALVPLVITKAFGAAAFPVNGTTTLTFTLTNPNATPLTGAAFSDMLPVGLSFVSVLSNPCGLTGNFTPGLLTITSGTIPANASCLYTISVMGTSPGIKVNTSSTLTTNEAPTSVNPATATVVVALPPTISKTFGVSVIPLNGVTTLAITINNPNATTALSGVAVTDNLPSGLKVANPNGLVSSCGGIATAIAGTGVVSLTNGLIPINGSCTIAINVTGVETGLQTNTTNPVTSIEGGTGGTATASITVGGNFLITYAANLTAGDSVINLNNTGANGAALNGPGFGSPAGNLCMNVYAFSPDEQLISCCSCLVTPNGLVSLSVNADLISNTLTGVRPNSVIVKVVPTGAGAGFVGSTCTNSAAVAGQNAANPLIASGSLGFGTTIHPLGAAFSTTENAMRQSTLSAQELASITNRCTNIIGNGSTFGVCRSCRAGGLMASN